jgi:hypothetical protein
VRKVVISLMALLFLAGSVASYRSGLLFRLFMADRMGAFSVVIDTEGRGDSFTYGKMELFREKEGSLSSLGTYRPSPGEGRLSYRESGLYRMRLEWGNRVEWRSFFLPPLDDESGGVSLRFTAPPLRKSPVSLTVDLYDAVSGEPVRNKGAVFISSDKGWEPLAEDSLLLSGDSYLLGFSVPGYEEQSLALDLDFYEDEVFLDIELIPQSGHLSVQHNLEKLSLRVNGKKRLRREDGSVNRFGSLNLEGNLWDLSPGVYRLDWSGSGWSQEQKLTIRGGETVVYRIMPDEEEGVRFEINRKR